MVNLLISLSLASCSLLSPYQPDVQQGNVMTANRVNQLKVGMTLKQVEAVMQGPPLLEDVFDRDTVSYVYTLIDGRTNNNIKVKRVQLIFNHGRLIKIDQLD